MKCMVAKATDNTMTGVGGRRGGEEGGSQVEEPEEPEVTKKRTVQRTKILE